MYSCSFTVEKCLELTKMSFIIQLVATLLAVLAVTEAVPFPKSSIKPQNQDQQDNYVPFLVDETNGQAFALPTNLQLPKVDDASKVPFFAPELSTDLKAPRYNPEPDFYTVPIPAQDLVAPVDTASWNTENDPKFFYEIPSVLVPQEVPTETFPKKFNKDVHTKSKPFSSKPKQEIYLEAISERDYGQKQKNLNKVFNKLAKDVNHKQVVKHAKHNKKADKHELQAAETGFEHGFNTEGVSSHNHLFSNDGGSHQQGLSADLTASLGISSPHHHGERLDFHMVGHDGPHSYKWGYDTGKGHNRQFRYEERDNGGIVKGHYGFYDKLGKLQMVNYDAFPHEGFHAEGNFGKSY